MSDVQANDTCERWETEGLLALERGQVLDAHFASCPDCLASRAALDAIAARIVTRGGAWQPPGDWEARVFARIAQEKPARRFAWWHAALPALLAAGVAVMVLRPTVGPTGADALLLTQGIVDARQVVRGETPKPGDGLSLSVAAQHVTHIGLRVYRDDRTLVFGCGSGDECPRTGENVMKTVTMDAPGEYRSLVIGGAAAIPAPAGSLDKDVESARALGLQVVLGEPVKVY